MNGNIHVVTGFSASGKSTRVRELMEKEPGCALLLEDKYFFYPRTLWAFANRFLFKRELAPNQATAVCDVIHEVLLNDALRMAKNGSQVIVDFASSPETISSLREAYKEARKQGINFEITWVSCSEATRQKRSAERDTAWDRDLVGRTDYFAAVSKLEREMWVQAGDLLKGPMHIEMNDQDMPSRRPSAHWPSLALAKACLGMTGAPNSYADALIRTANGDPTSKISASLRPSSGIDLRSFGLQH